MFVTGVVDRNARRKPFHVQSSDLCWHSSCRWAAGGVVDVNRLGLWFGDVHIAGFKIDSDTVGFVELTEAGDEFARRARHRSRRYYGERERDECQSQGEGGLQDAHRALLWSV